MTVEEVTWGDLIEADKTRQPGPDIDEVAPSRQPHPPLEGPQQSRPPTRKGGGGRGGVG